MSHFTVSLIVLGQCVQNTIFEEKELKFFRVPAERLTTRPSRFTGFGGGGEGGGGGGGGGVGSQYAKRYTVAARMILR